MSGATQQMLTFWAREPAECFDEDEMCVKHVMAFTLTSLNPSKEEKKFRRLWLQPVRQTSPSPSLKGT